VKRLTRKGVEGLIPYPPGKPIKELERELGIMGSIKLASNENPLGPSPFAVKAIMSELEALNRYPDGSGYYLKSRLSEKFAVPGENIILGNGSNELIELAVRTFLSSGEEAIQAVPTFLVYEKIVRGAGGSMKSVPLSNFGIDLSGILRKITPRTKLIFINNPNNPTGSLIFKKDMTAFLRELPKDIVILLDEAYIEFVTDKRAANGLEMLSEHPHIFILRTFSKLYGLAGLRIGYGFASPELIDFMNRVRQPFNANTLAQAAATAALEDDEFVLKTLRLVQEGLGYLYSELDKMGLNYLRTQTNFFLIKVPAGGTKTYERLLKKGVIIRSMESYDLPDYIRITVGIPEENERFIRALKAALSD